MVSFGIFQFFATQWLRSLPACILLFGTLAAQLEAQSLPTPVPLSPANGQTGVSTTPTLDWGSVSGATVYRVFVATSFNLLDFLSDTTTACTGCTINTTTGSSIYTVPASSALDPNRTYYWMVRAGSSSQGSLNSSIFSFLTASPPLPVPNPISPANNAVGVPTDPLLTWSAVSGATQYRVFVATSFTTLDNLSDTATSCSGCWINRVTSSPNYRITGSETLTQDRNYYWMVRAGNSSQGSPNSTIYTFRTIPPPLPTPTPLTPENNSVGVPTDPLLTWTSVFGATQYRLFVATSFTTLDNLSDTATSCSGCWINRVTSSPNYRITGSETLTQDRNYYWMVRAGNSSQGSPNSTIYTFRTIPPPLPTPTPLTPENNSVGVPTDPLLTWTSVFGATQYRLFVATSFSTLDNLSDTATSCSGCWINRLTATNSYRISGSETLAQDRSYYWMIRAGNDTQGSVNSTIYAFETAAPDPTVSLIAPNSGSFGVGDAIDIQWQSTHQHHYLLELFKGGEQPSHVVGVIRFEPVSTANAHVWTVPDRVYDIDGQNPHLIDGNDYKIKIAVWNSAGVAIGDFSDQFLEIRPAIGSVFNDLEPDHWAYQAALFLFDNGLLEPDNGNIRPLEDANRAELAKLAFLGAEIPPLADGFPCPFNDLQELDAQTEWYYSYAKNLSYLEFGDGISAFTRDRFNFYPAQAISRAHTLKLLLETWNIPVQQGGSVPYGDVAPDHDAFDYIYTAYQLGIIDGDQPDFRPNANLMRAEMFVMLYNIMAVLGMDPPQVGIDDFFPAGNYTPANLGMARGLVNDNFRHLTKTSFLIPGIGIPLVFEHVYHSFLTELPEEFFPLRPLGQGWSHAYNAYICRIGDERLVFWPSGAIHVYRTAGAAVETLSEGVYDEWNTLGANRVEIIKKNRIAYSFERLSGASPDFPMVLTQIRDRNGNAVNLSYEPAQRNGFLRLARVTGTAGRQLVLSYHAGSDLVLRVTDPIGRTISFDYSGYDTQTADLTSFTDAKNQETIYQYNATAPERHLLRYIRLPRGNTITNTYRDRKLTSTRGDTGPAVLVNTIRNYGQTGDDNFTRTTIIDRENRSYTLSHRRNGRLGSVSAPENYSATYLYEDPDHSILPTTVQRGDGLTVHLQYDIRGNLVQEDWPLGVRFRYAYNARNDLTQFTDPRDKVTAFDYDAAGNLTGVTSPLGHTLSATYNGMGQLASMTNAVGQTVAYQYDGHGNLASIQAPEGIASSTVYDGVGRPLTATGPRNRDRHFQYDANDNLTSVQDLFLTTVAYNENDDPIRVTNARGGATILGYNPDDLLESIRFQGFETRFAYYEDGSLSRKTDPDNSVTDYFYDGLARLTGDANGNGYVYDARGNLQTASNAEGSLGFAYDGLNRISAGTDFFGNTVSYDYDAAGNVTGITYPGNLTVTYGYDDDGRLVTVTDWVGRTTFYDYRADDRLDRIRYPNGVVTSYGYDGAGRMTDLVHGAGSATIAAYGFTLDAAGNHVAVDANEPLDGAPTEETSLVLSYDAANRIVNAGGTAFAHDPNGNATQKGSRTYSFNRERALTSVSGAGFSASYRYDALGNRRAATREGVETRYVLDINAPLSRVLMETDGADNVRHYYVYGLGMVARIAPDGTAHYYHHDFRGSTVAMTDAAQNPTHRYAYDPFGRLVGLDEADPNPFRYVGRFGVMFETDDLYYMRARFYDPTIGRFLGEDPVWSTNLYAYAGNNPMMNIDPNGRFMGSLLNITKLLVKDGKKIYSVLTTIYSLLEIIDSKNEEERIDYTTGFVVSTIASAFCKPCKLGTYILVDLFSNYIGTKVIGPFSRRAYEYSFQEFEENIIPVFRELEWELINYPIGSRYFKTHIYPF